MAKSNNERGLIQEEVRKVQSRLNRIASTVVLSEGDEELYLVTTQWLRNELQAQAEAVSAD